MLTKASKAATLIDLQEELQTVSRLVADDAEMIQPSLESEQRFDVSRVFSEIFK